MTSKARQLANLLADGAVGTNEIADSAVTTAKIGDNQVTDAKISGLNASKLSGDVATARLGSGTASSTTFLRGDRTWQTVETTPTTAQVLNATAGASLGAVGSYALAFPTGSSRSPGVVVAGSTLRYASTADSLPGTWRTMSGMQAQSYGPAVPGLVLRIS